MTDQESLIREAVAAEADQAVDHRAVLADLHRKRSRRRPIALIAAAALTAAAAAVAVVVPLVVDRTAAPVEPATPPAAPVGQTVLLLGLDGGPRTDSVVLARVGPDGSVGAASLPRDARVEIPGVGMGKLNSVYARAHAAAQAEGRDGAAEGARAVVGTVEALTGVRIDHYAAVDMAGFAAVADAVGGVEVCLRNDARDPFSGTDLPAGRHSLNGEQALAFLRQRHGLDNGDFDRALRQQAFLHALVAKVAGGVEPAELSRLVEVARSHVRTDPDWDLFAFARQLRPSVRTATIPVRSEVVTDDGVALLTDPAEVRAFAADFFADKPSGTATPASPAKPGDGCVN